MSSGSLIYERLNLLHDFLPFDCGDNDLNEFLYLNSKSYQKQFEVYKAKMEALLISQLELLKDMKEE